MFKLTAPYKYSFFFFFFLNALRLAILTLYVRETKIDEFANTVGLGEVAHYEPLHLDLHCLSSSL